MIRSCGRASARRREWVHLREDDLEVIKFLIKSRRWRTTPGRTRPRPSHLPQGQTAGTAHRNHPDRICRISGEGSRLKFAPSYTAATPSVSPPRFDLRHSRCCRPSPKLPPQALVDSGGMADVPLDTQE